MASTEKLPSGRYRPVARDAAGQKIPKLGTYARKRDAQHAADEAEVKARRQASSRTGAIQASITWAEWWEMFNADRVFESDTAAVEENLVTKHISPHWGEVPLNQIDRPAVQQWVNILAKKRTPPNKKQPAGKVYEPTYVRRIYALFATSINAALSHEPPVLLTSPLVKIRLPLRRKKGKTFIPMVDAPKLETQLRDDYADALAFGLETGLRPGELAGLHDDQIDDVGRVLTVSHVYVRRAKRIRDYPKDKDARLLPLSARAVAIYQRRTAGRDMSRPCGVEHYSGMCPGELVFRTASGGVLKQDLLTEALTRAATKAGLPGRGGYALRRGFATRLARGGIDLFELMDIMGWSDPALAREYVQESPGARDRMMAALGDPEATGLRIVKPHEVPSRADDDAGSREHDQGTQNDRSSSA